jgi:dipeptidyl aminopeptidase/acylaminoacyl peptidase
MKGILVRKKKSLLIITCFLLMLVLFIFPLVTKTKNSPLEKFEKIKLSNLVYEEIEFINKQDNTRLGGMLFLPAGKTDFPIAVIIHGSGPSNRNNSWYLGLTRGLLKKGVGVLLPDKRGSEKSGGNWKGKTIEELATDTESAIHFLREKNELSFSKIGIIGVSQGGWIAPVVAGQTEDLDFVINISGSFTAAEEQLVFEEENNIKPYTYDLLAKMIAKLSVIKVKRSESVLPFVKFSPIPYWKKVKTKTLIAYGENDTNCPVELSLEKFKKEKLGHIKLKVYKDGKHAILDETKTKISPVLFRDIEQLIFHKKD